LHQGVSGTIKKQGWLKPYKEFAKYGPIPIGEARIACPGTLPLKLPALELRGIFSVEYDFYFKFTL